MLLLPLLALADAAELYAVEPARLPYTAEASTPVRLYGAGLSDALALELPSPEGGPPLRLPLSASDGLSAELVLPPGLPVGEHALRLVGPGVEPRCADLRLHVDAPRCEALSATFEADAIELSEDQRLQLRRAGECLLARGARELVVLTSASPGEGVEPPAESYAGPLPYVYNPRLAEERAARAAADLTELGLPVTSVAMPRPLPDGPRQGAAAEVRVVARYAPAEGFLPCPLDEPEGAGHCLVSKGASALVIVAGADGRAAAVAEAYGEAPLPVEVALGTAAGPTRLIPITRSSPLPMSYDLEGCSPTPARAPARLAAAPGPSWLRMAAVGVGLVGTDRSADGLGVWTWADLHLGLAQGPFVGVSAGLLSSPGGPEPRAALMLGWETPLPDRRPAYLWVGPTLGEAALMAGLAAPLLDALDGRLRPTAELRGVVGLDEHAPWGLGLGLSVSWRTTRPLPEREGPR